MRPSLVAFATELEKLAASPPANADWAEIPYDRRLADYEAYVRAQAAEARAGYGKSTAVGGLIGGGLGGIVGASMAADGLRRAPGRMLRHGAIGAAGGAVLGGILGALAAKVHNMPIAAAQQTVTDGAFENGLHGEIASRRAGAAWREAQDRLERQRDRFERDRYYSSRRFEEDDEADADDDADDDAFEDDDLVQDADLVDDE